MSHQISYSSISLNRRKLISLFSGSSNKRIVDGEIITVKRDHRNQVKEKIREEVKKIIEESFPIDEKILKENKKSYKLNKSKVRKKCHALSRLKKSKNFLAFYSISFPCGLSDEICYKIFNTWLTRCRTNCSLKSYLWIAERQKNGTIHFHMLTNDYMPIIKVNGFMASCLASEREKGVDVLKEIKTENYNGVDVKKVDKNRKSLIGYLTKYITKNDIEFSHLPWHCSRDVSRLFTSINFDSSERDKYFDQIPESPEKYNVYITDNYKVAGFKFRPNEKIYEDLDILNETIYHSQKKLKE
ncbi:MAG: hypothetical protein MUO72_18640 [Bacteroidales bacterium]|nr:hypothetical protein [Bacteroidales bacterium]